jgi:hypothetical protein
MAERDPGTTVTVDEEAVLTQISFLCAGGPSMDRVRFLADLAPGSVQARAVARFDAGERQ